MIASTPARSGPGNGPPRGIGQAGRDLGPAHDVGPAGEQATDVERGAQQIGIRRRRRLQRGADAPHRIVGFVGHAGGVGLEVRQAVEARVQRVAQVRIDVGRLAAARRRSASASASPVPTSRIAARSEASCIIANEMPRPSDGFVHASASPTATTPVAIGSTVDDEAPDAVRDASHHVDTRHRLGVDPRRRRAGSSPAAAARSRDPSGARSARSRALATMTTDQ